MKPRRRGIPYQVWFGLMWASAAVGVLAALGGHLASRTGLFLVLVSLAATVVVVSTSFSTRILERLEMPINRLQEETAGVCAILERIERLLNERLPPR